MAEGIVEKGRLDRSWQAFGIKGRALWRRITSLVCLLLVRDHVRFSSLMALAQRCSGFGAFLLVMLSCEVASWFDVGG